MVLVVLHGGGGNGEQVRETSGIAERALRAGFVVAFPDGTGPLRTRLLTWNSGGIPVYAQEHDIDDVGFLKAVVADVQKRVAIDAARVFATGHSNGGMMCHRLAREAADVFRGIAVVAGAADRRGGPTALVAHVLVGAAVDQQDRDRRRRLGRREVHRAGERSDASVQAAIDYYVARNGLVGYPERREDGKVRTDTWAKGKDGKAALPVRVVTLDGGGHAWPGAANKTRAVADAPFPFDASAAIVTFFAELGAVTTPGAAPAGR